MRIEKSFTKPWLLVLGITVVLWGVLPSAVQAYVDCWDELTFQFGRGCVEQCHHCDFYTATGEWVGYLEWCTDCQF